MSNISLSSIVATVHQVMGGRVGGLNQNDDFDDASRGGGGSGT